MDGGLGQLRCARMEPLRAARQPAVWLDEGHLAPVKRGTACAVLGALKVTSHRRSWFEWRIGNSLGISGLRHLYPQDHSASSPAESATCPATLYQVSAYRYEMNALDRQQAQAKISELQDSLWRGGKRPNPPTLAPVDTPFLAASAR